MICKQYFVQYSTQLLFHVKQFKLERKIRLKENGPMFHVKHKKQYHNNAGREKSIRMIEKRPACCYNMPAERSKNRTV